MDIRKAYREDMGRLLEIFDSARAFQRSIGFRQWEDGYPSAGVLESDINNGGARVFTEAGAIVGYVFLALNDEAYLDFRGIWPSASDFGVIHRLAVSEDIRGRHKSDSILKMIEDECRSMGIKVIRADTGENNIIMKRILHKNDYVFVGTFDFRWDRRLAYEKVLVGV